MTTLLSPPLFRHNDPTSADTRHSLVAWWGEMQAILYEIGDAARRVTEQLRPGGSLEGLMDADDLALFAARMDEQATELNNNPPLAAAVLPDPMETTFEDVKRVTLAWLASSHPDHTDADVELTIMEPHGISRQVFGIRDADEEDEPQVVQTENASEA